MSFDINQRVQYKGPRYPHLKNLYGVIGDIGVECGEWSYTIKFDNGSSCTCCDKFLVDHESGEGENTFIKNYGPGDYVKVNSYIREKECYGRIIEYSGWYGTYEIKTIDSSENTFANDKLIQPITKEEYDDYVDQFKNLHKNQDMVKTTDGKVAAPSNYDKSNKLYKFFYNLFFHDSKK